MENKKLLQMLAIHGDLLNGHAIEALASEQISEGERKELLSFAELAKQIGDALAPVKPSASFKQELQQSLMERARGRMHMEVHIAVSAHQRNMLIGAAVGSAIALVGSVAYLMRAWVRGRSQHMGQVGM